MAILERERNHSLDGMEIERLVARFHRDGCVVVPGVLALDEVAALKDAASVLLDDPRLAGSEYRETVMGTDLLRYLPELSTLFRDLLVREPLLGLAEAIVGEGCRQCGCSVIRNTPGQAISLWHVDDVVEFPLPPALPRHDTQLQMPVNWVGIQIPLTDIEAEEYGPTQYVPGSHYSGRKPVTQDNPEFDGHGPTNIVCRAGDVYLQNFQCWHRGAPNRSTRTRILMQMFYGRAWATKRFSYLRADRLTPEMLLGAGERLRQILGV